MASPFQGRCFFSNCRKHIKFSFYSLKVFRLIAVAGSEFGLWGENKFGSATLVILIVVCPAAGGRVPSVGGDGRRWWKLHFAVPVQRGSRHVQGQFKNKL